MNDRSDFIGRLVSFGFIAILLALTTFSIWTALHTQQVVASVTSSEYLNEQYQQARSAVIAEESSAHDYRLAPGPASLATHSAAAADLLQALHNIAQQGNARDHSIVEQILATHQRYLEATHLMFLAVDKGNITLALHIDYTMIDPPFSAMQQQVYVEAISYRTQAGQRLADLATTAQVVFVSTLIVFPLGLLLFAGLVFVILTYKRKVNQGTNAEMIRLTRTAFVDNLTDLGNHRAYQEQFHDLLASPSEDGKGLTLAIIDIDELKMINDASGYLEGDRILTAFAEILRNGRFSYIYRLSGDEFAIILPDTTLCEATDRMEQLRQDVERGLSGATVSIGLANSLSSDNEGAVLQEQTYLAVSEAKRRSHNTVVTFEAIREGVSLIAPAKVHALHRLLKEQRINVAFQPIWDLERDHILSFEALMRPPAEYGFNGPQEVFDIAEKIGRAHELDYVCVQAILTRAAELPSDALLFLNLTPQTLDHDVLTGKILIAAVLAAGLTPDRVVIEITERSVVRLEVVVREARKLRELGFRLALDDTGAGNAGLEMLSQLPVDFVKIDRAIVVNALTDAAPRAILSGITTMARQMKSYVIAEGIENVEMLTLVQKMGVQGVQGYLLGRPNQVVPDAQALQALSPSTHMRHVRVTIASQ